MLKGWSHHGVFAVFLFGVVGCMSASSESLPGSLIGPPSLSPDGKTVAFSYGKSTDNNRLVLFDIASSTLRMLGKPSRVITRAPTFSPDGTKLAVPTYCREACEGDEFGYQISVVDLRVGSFQNVTSGRGFVRERPIFSPDGKKIFFVATHLTWKDEWSSAGRSWDESDGDSKRYGFSGISQVDLKTGEESPVFPNERMPTGFLALFLGGAGADDSIVFSARGPHDGEIESLVEQADQETASLGYFYSPGRGLELIPESQNRSMSSLSMSSDGRRVVFVSSEPDSPFDYDLYQISDGEVSPITSMSTHLAHARIASEGHMVVFLEDRSRQKNWSVWIHDIATGESRLILSHEALIDWMK